jgi:hypothetical protein
MIKVLVQPIQQQAISYQTSDNERKRTDRERDKEREKERKREKEKKRERERAQSRIFKGQRPTQNDWPPQQQIIS